jgi:hypothetical protein
MHAYHALEARATTAYIIENLLAPKFTSPIPNATQHASLHACSIDRHLTMYLPGRRLLVFLSGCHTTRRYRLMVVDGNGQRQRERLRLSLSGPHFIPRYVRRRSSFLLQRREDVSPTEHQQPAAITISLFPLHLHRQPATGTLTDVAC